MICTKCDGEIKHSQQTFFRKYISGRLVCPNCSAHFVKVETNRPKQIMMINFFNLFFIIGFIFLQPWLKDNFSPLQMTSTMVIYVLLAALLLKIIHYFSNKTKVANETVYKYRRKRPFFYINPRYKQNYKDYLFVAFICALIISFFVYFA